MQAEPWIADSVRQRLLLVMQAFPGMTPDRVWDLPYVEWLLVAVGAEQWAEDQKRQQRDAEAATSRGR